jgi:hypothetical protein
MYLFAKEAGALSPLGGSNPPLSANELREFAERSKQTALLAWGIRKGSPIFLKISF